MTAEAATVQPPFDRRLVRVGGTGRGQALMGAADPAPVRARDHPLRLPRRALGERPSGRK